MRYQKYLMPILTLAMAVMMSSFAPSISHSESTKEGKYSVAGLDDEKEVNSFFLRFQDAVARHEKEQVAAMIDYPIKAISASGKTLKIENQKKFVEKYDNIFDSLFTTTITKKKVNELWANYQGVATETGEIWLGGVFKGKSNMYVLKIIAINGMTGRHK